MMNSLFILLLFCFSINLIVSHQYSTQHVIQNLCENGDLYTAFENFKAINDDAQAYHCLASLQLILYSNIDEAVSLHKLGKQTDFTVIPPLAKMHLENKDCAGLGDLFYVSAVIIKELVDTNKALPNVIKALKTLITLTSDSGLSNAAEIAINLAITLDPSDHSLYFRSAVLTPGVYESYQHIQSTRMLLQERIDNLINSSYNYVLKGLDEFTMSPTFYFVYQGYNDKNILYQLQNAYIKAYPKLGTIEILHNINQNKYYYQQQQAQVEVEETDLNLPIKRDNKKKIKIGFVSSYFRRHSICKLFCNIMLGLDTTLYDIYAFSSLSQQSEDNITLSIRNSDSVEYVSIGMTFIQNRYEVVNREIDILIYLDVGMDPSIAAWAAARLAPIQMVIWGHPDTTGYTSIDYYLSSGKFHQYPYTINSHSLGLERVITEEERVNMGGERVNFSTTATAMAYKSFTEQLILFDSLGFMFDRPLLPYNFYNINKEIMTQQTLALQSQQEVEFLAHIDRPPSYYTIIYNQLKKRKNEISSQQLMNLIKRKRKNSTTIVLLPQHLPKFHPIYDVSIVNILILSQHSLITIIDNKNKKEWKNIIKKRIQMKLNLIIKNCYYNLSICKQNNIELYKNIILYTIDKIEIIINNYLERIIWLSALNPFEYLTLLAIGDVMLDPFPFGGGVTTLESLAVCTPVITLPDAQSVPQLATGMLAHMELASSVFDVLVVHSIKQYIQHTLAMLHSAHTGGILGIPNARSPQYVHMFQEGDEGVVLQNKEVQEEVVEQDVLQNKEVSVENEEVLNLISIRRQLCARAHRIFDQNDTLQDWNTFLFNAAITTLEERKG